MIGCLHLSREIQDNVGTPCERQEEVLRSIGSLDRSILSPLMNYELYEYLLMIVPRLTREWRKTTANWFTNWRSVDRVAWWKAENIFSSSKQTDLEMQDRDRICFWSRSNSSNIVQLKQKKLTKCLEYTIFGILKDWNHRFSSAESTRTSWRSNSSGWR